MSLSSNVIRFAVIISVWVRSTTSYKCFGSRCMCLDPSGCSTNCTNGFCQNKEFVCTEKVNHCSFECQDIASCQDSRFYMASNQFSIHCSDANACSNSEIYCGVPPQLPSQLAASDFDGRMQTCAISASTASIQNSYISCSGNIENCYVESEPNDHRIISTASILDSEFDCSISGQCSFNCSYGCYRSIYSCTTSTDAQCKCNQCNQTDGVYIETISTTASVSSSAYNTGNTFDVIHGINTIDGNDTDGSDKNRRHPLFDLTDGNVSNLEILYYIIMSAGMCLLCCICLCVFMICMVRSSVVRDREEDKSSENNSKMSKSAASTYRIYGQNEGSGSNDSVLDIGSTQSSDDDPLQLTKRYNIGRNGDDASSIEYEENDKNTVSTHESVHRMIAKVSKPYDESSDSASQSDDMSSEHNLIESEYKSPIQPPSTIIVKHIDEADDDEAEEEDEDDDDIAIHMDRELSSPRSNLKIKLTKPHNGRLKPMENVDDEDKNRLTPNSRMGKKMQYCASPMSPLSGISSSNPDPDEGMDGHNMAAMYADSITSAESSEANLKIKSRPTSEIDLMPQPQPFPNQLLSRQFEEMMADYANVSRGRSATQFAAMKQQLLWIQQQNHRAHTHKRSYSGSNHSSNSSRVQLPRVEMIKPSMHHCHTATVSNPTLPVIESDGHNSDDVMTPSLTQEASSKRHGYCASDRSSRISSSSNDCTEEESLSCSCSECIRNQEDNETNTNSRYLGTPCGSNNSSSASSNSSCNDTRCSCHQCTASCISSADHDSCSSSGDTDSSRSRSTSDVESSASSSYTGSDDETVTTTTVMSEEIKSKSKKRNKNKKNKMHMNRYDTGSVDSDVTPSVMMSYTRGENRTMVIHEDMSTDTHSRAPTGHSNLSVGLSTIESTVGTKDHDRMKTFVIHDVGSVDSE